MTELSKQVIKDNGLKIKPPRHQNLYSVRHAMAFVTSDNKQVSGFMICRDHLHDLVRAYVNGKQRVIYDGHTWYPEEGDPELCMDNLKLLIAFNNNLLKNFICGMKVLNSFEKYADMELSTGEIVQSSITDKKHTSVLITGSGEYMKNPHLLSMVTLIIRFCTQNPKFEYNNIEDLGNSYLDMLGKYILKQDGSLMGACHEIMHEVLKERKQLFKDITLEELYPVSLGTSFHSKGGIMELCSNRSPNKVVNNRIVELKRKTADAVKAAKVVKG